MGRVWEGFAHMLRRGVIDHYLRGYLWAALLSIRTSSVIEDLLASRFGAELTLFSDVYLSNLEPRTYVSGFTVYERVYLLLFLRTIASIKRRFHLYLRFNRGLLQALLHDGVLANTQQHFLVHRLTLLYANLYLDLQAVRLFEGVLYTLSMVGAQRITASSSRSVYSSALVLARNWRANQALSTHRPVTYPGAFAANFSAVFHELVSRRTALLLYFSAFQF